MRTSSDTILVFTSESLGALVGEGGSQAWKINAARAARCAWLLCVRNQRPLLGRNRQAGAEPHGAGFLLGRISSITVPARPSDEDRWKIAFGEFAHIDQPDLWDGSQNPVRYAHLAALGIDTAKLLFRPVRLWNGWAGMPGPSGYRQSRPDTLAASPGIAAEGGRR